MIDRSNVALVDDWIVAELMWPVSPPTVPFTTSGPVLSTFPDTFAPLAIVVALAALELLESAPDNDPVRISCPLLLTLVFPALVLTPDRVWLPLEMDSEPLPDKLPE